MYRKVVVSLQYLIYDDIFNKSIHLLIFEIHDHFSSILVPLMGEVVLLTKTGVFHYRTIHFNHGVNI